MIDQAISGIISGVVIAIIAGVFFLARTHQVAFAQLWSVFFFALMLTSLLAGGFALGELYGVANLRHLATQGEADLSQVEYNYLPLIPILLPLLVRCGVMACQMA